MKDDKLNVNLPNRDEDKKKLEESELNEVHGDLKDRAELDQIKINDEVLSEDLDDREYPEVPEEEAEEAEAKLKADPKTEGEKTIERKDVIENADLVIERAVMEHLKQNN